MRSMRPEIPLRWFGGTIAGEPVIVKNFPSSFFQTDLGTQLEAAGRSDLVLAGFMTHMCVNSTARNAFNLGYRRRSWPARPPPASCPADPGVIDTGAWDVLGQHGKADYFATISAANPARRIGTPDDIVHTVMFALANTFLTGQTPARRRRRTTHLTSPEDV
jgi:Isochorismatase family